MLSVIHSHIAKEQCIGIKFCFTLGNSVFDMYEVLRTAVLRFHGNHLDL